MKKLICFFLLFVSSLGYSQTLPFEGFDGVFYNPSTLTHHEGQDFDVTQNGGSEYQEYHGFLPVLRQHPYLYYPNFEIGIMDVGIFSKHEDLHKFYKGFLGLNQDFVPQYSHGTLVASITGASQVNNGIGTHGIVNAKIDFMNRGDFNDEGYFENFLEVSHSKVINVSIALAYCTTPQAYRNAKSIGETSCGLDENSVYTPEITQQHIENVQAVREFIQSKSDILFVFAAGNSGMDARVENGAIHYAIDANGNPYLSKLPNVLVVGAIDNQGILTSYSNYGWSVDIVALGKAYGPSEVITTYHEGYPNENTSGAGSTLPPAFPPTVTHTYETSNGTSFAAPIVHGATTLMKSADNSIPPYIIKDFLTDRITNSVSSRYTGEKDENGVLIEESILELPILDFSSAFSVYSGSIDWDTYMHTEVLSGAVVDFSSQGDQLCEDIFDSRVLEENYMNGINPNYEAKFYGERCLFFRANSYVIDFDLITKVATRHTFEGYGPNKFREYMTFRNFVNNLNTANTHNDWRINYGLMQNGFGHVSCSTVDTCVTNTFTTVEECKNLFKALTGDNPAVMGSAQTSLKSQNVCVYSTDKVVVEYDANVGEVNVSKKVMNVQNLISFLQSKVDYWHGLWTLNHFSMYVLSDGWIEFNEYGYPVYFHGVNNHRKTFMEYISPQPIYKEFQYGYFGLFKDISSMQNFEYDFMYGEVYLE